MYCPEWIFGCSAAYTARGFLLSESSLNGIARKFSKGLSEKYEQVTFEEISQTAEGILQFLSEIEAGDEAVNYIGQYIFKRIHFWLPEVCPHLRSSEAINFLKKI